MNVERIRDLRDFYRSTLLDNVLPFWERHAIDRECGGFFSYLDADGSVFHTDKAIWIQGRYTWLNALLYNQIENRPCWRRNAVHGIDFLSKYGFDTDGRMFFETLRNGMPLRKRRYVFSETFASIAYSEAGRALKDDRMLARGHEIFRTLVDYYRHPEKLPSKTVPGSRPAKSHAMTMIMIATAQQMRKTGSETLCNEMIEHCIHEVFNHFFQPQVGALLETVAPDGSMIDTPDGRCVNPGHALETAWFILEEARQSRRPDLIDPALRIIDGSLRLGWDEMYGGVYYFVDVEGKPCIQYEHDMKLWWPHTEAIYATLLAWRMTGDARWRKWFERLHEYAFDHFPDHVLGEWFKYLHRDGSVSHRLKGNGWAGPFHLPRMLIYGWQLLDEILNSTDSIADQLQR